MSSSARLNRVKDFAGKKFYVRYMLSLRCKKIVSDVLNQLDSKHIILPYGAIEFPDGISLTQINLLKRNLHKSGLDLLDLRESIVVDKIISTVLEVIHDFDYLPNLSYSEVISKNLPDANESVLKIFTEVVGMSIIQFIVFHKIERVKEHLLYNELSLLEISKKLNYKSENHLIAQFKKLTGLTPYHYMKLKEKRNRIIAKSVNESNGEKHLEISHEGE